MSIDDLFSIQSVVLELPAASKSEALEAMVQHAARTKLLPSPRREQVIQMLLERETRGSTAFGGGIAMPHARVPKLRRAFGLVARSSEGIDFKAIDGEPVHVLVMLISPENKADEHLETLRWISLAARDPDFQSFILQARSEAEVLDVLQERAP